ncbi:MAG: hypothetical protein CMJ46_12770 [Planctomyces sp.]|nr:hypothetical protein [Planctomyces sp.]
MKVILQVERGEAPRKQFAVSRNTLIGRSNSCDLRIDSDDVSRRHCFLVVTDEGVWVRDLDSANGTRVEGYSLSKGEDCLLNPGAHVAVGPVEFSIHFELEREPAVAQLGAGHSAKYAGGHHFDADETECAEPETSSFGVHGHDDDTVNINVSNKLSQEKAGRKNRRFDPPAFTAEDDSSRLRSLLSQLVGWKKNRP